MRCFLLDVFVADGWKPHLQIDLPLDFYTGTMLTGKNPSTEENVDIHPNCVSTQHALWQGLYQFNRYGLILHFHSYII